MVYPSVMIPVLRDEGFYWALLIASVIGLIIGGSYAAFGQVQFRPYDSHAQHHPHYQNWINQADKSCCNNQDCGELAESNERTSSGKLEVRIEGEWCEILPHHYLKRGNVPNAASSHVCVQQNMGGKTVCERLKCYQPRPGT